MRHAMKRWLFGGLGLTAFLCAAPAAMAQQPHDAYQDADEVVLESNRLHVDDFDLEAVMGLIQDDRVDDARHLEAFINDANGINNVDIDGDGYIDAIVVREVERNEDVVFEFLAVPSSKPGGAMATVASITFTNAAEDQMEIVGRYPTYVHPQVYTTTVVHCNRHGFVTWAYYTPRPYYTFVYHPSRYPRRAVYRRGVLVHHRTTFRRTYPVRRVVRVHGSRVTYRRAARRPAARHRYTARRANTRRGVTTRRRVTTTRRATSRRANSRRAAPSRAARRSASRREAPRSERRDANRTERRSDARSNRRGGEASSERRDGARSGNRDSARSNRRDSARSGNRSDARSNNRSGARSGNRDSARSNRRDNARSGNRSGARSNRRDASRRSNRRGASRRSTTRGRSRGNSRRGSSRGRSRSRR